MKIVKLPVETTIKCKCGCEFEFDCDDLIVNVLYSMDYEEDSQVVVRCPFCRQDHILKHYGEKK